MTQETLFHSTQTVCNDRIQLIIDELYWDLKNTNDYKLTYLNNLLKQVEAYMVMLKKEDRSLPIEYTPLLSPIDDTMIKAVVGDVFDL